MLNIIFKLLYHFLSEFGQILPYVKLSHQGATLLKLRQEMLFQLLGEAPFVQAGSWDQASDSAIGGADYGKHMDASIYDDIKSEVSLTRSCSCCNFCCMCQYFSPFSMFVAPFYTSSSLLII